VVSIQTLSFAVSSVANNLAIQGIFAKKHWEHKYT